MERERFEDVVQEEFDALPERFKTAMDNVRIAVEDEPHGQRRGRMLLGLYHGVPLTRRGAEYGTFPAVPDTITLYRINIESLGSSEEEIRRNIRDTLIHEIGHYYGMSEAEIRRAGY